VTTTLRSSDVSETIEQLSGRGSVLLGERQVATVQYTIVVTQEYIDTSTFAERSRIPGMKSARGHMEVIGGARDLELANVWTLVLDDGRRCQCMLQNMKLTAATYTFSVMGAIA
jgi:hypothetical protein